MPASGEGQLYRIAARGAGSMPGARVALQAYFRKPPDGARGQRVGWREIGNWSALVAAAAE
jgi:type IV pilus assembly protein PilX